MNESNTEKKIHFFAKCTKCEYVGLKRDTKPEATKDANEHMMEKIDHKTKVLAEQSS
jgi:hypothetical protein